MFFKYFSVSFSSYFFYFYQPKNVLENFNMIANQIIDVNFHRMKFQLKSYSKRAIKLVDFL